MSSEQEAQGVKTRNQGNDKNNQTTINQSSPPSSSLTPPRRTTSTTTTTTTTTRRRTNSPNFKTTRTINSSTKLFQENSGTQIKNYKSNSYNYLDLHGLSLREVEMIRMNAAASASSSPFGRRRRRNTTFHRRHSSMPNHPFQQQQQQEKEHFLKRTYTSLSLTPKIIVAFFTFILLLIFTWLGIFSISPPSPSSSSFDMTQDSPSSSYSVTSNTYSKVPKWEWDWYHYHEKNSNNTTTPSSSSQQQQQQNQKRNILLIQATISGPLEDLMNDVTSKPNRAYAKRWGYNYLRYTGCYKDALLFAGVDRSKIGKEENDSQDNNDDDDDEDNDQKGQIELNEEGENEEEELFGDGKETSIWYYGSRNNWRGKGEDEEEVGGRWRYNVPIKKRQKKKHHYPQQQQEQQQEQKDHFSFRHYKKQEEEKQDHDLFYSPYFIYALLYQKKQQQHQQQMLLQEQEREEAGINNNENNGEGEKSANKNGPQPPSPPKKKKIAPPIPTFYDAVMILDVDAVIVDMDFDILNLLPSDALVSIRYDDFVSQRKENGDGIDDGSGAILWNLNHAESWNVVESWIRYIEQSKDDDNGENGGVVQIESELDALRMILKKKYNDSAVASSSSSSSLVHAIKEPILNFMDGTVIKYMKRNDNDSNEINVPDQSSSKQVEKKNKVDWLLGHLGHVFVAMQGIVDMTCYRFYPQCELI